MVSRRQPLHRTPQGNIYLAGSAVIDPASQSSGAAVAKVNPKATNISISLISIAPPATRCRRLRSTARVTPISRAPPRTRIFRQREAARSAPLPAGSTDARSFVTKLSPQGVVVFSVLIGGSATSAARGIAIAPQGQILVSGIASSKGFPATPGAYAVADSTNQWFLVELDGAASKVIFSATGIGGSSLALDATGNIYMAGSSVGANYPTTPGAYQTTFSQGSYCFGFCQSGFAGNLQHVTKTDPAASKLIYSTGINDPKGLAGSTTNTGLAVDAAGDAYVTGTLFEGKYPFTVTAPAGSTSYLTKLDPAGANLLFSVPVGGGGVQLDSSGAIYVGGAVTSVSLPWYPGRHVRTAAIAIPPIFARSSVHVCLPNFTTAISEAYVMKVDPATGAVQDAQWIDGSAPGATGITLAGGKVWITGPARTPRCRLPPIARPAKQQAPDFWKAPTYPQSISPTQRRDRKRLPACWTAVTCLMWALLPPSS